MAVRLAIPLLVIVIACEARRQPLPRDTARADSARPAPMPAVQGDSVTPLLETGCAGGVTGGGAGAFLTADGRFYRYERNGPQPNVAAARTFVKKDSVRAATLVHLAEQEGIMRITYSEPSNVTCSLSLSRNGVSHEIAWRMGTTPRPIAKLIGVAKQLDDAAR